MGRPWIICMWGPCSSTKGHVVSVSSRRMWSEIWTVRLKEVPRTHARTLVRAQLWPHKHGWDQTGDETQVLLMSDQLGLRMSKRHDSSFFRLCVHAHVCACVSAHMCACVRKAGSSWESPLGLSFCRWSTLHNIYKMKHTSAPQIFYQDGGAVIYCNPQWQLVLAVKCVCTWLWMFALILIRFPLGFLRVGKKLEGGGCHKDGDKGGEESSEWIKWIRDASEPVE